MSTFHVEVLVEGGYRTDMTTRSRYLAKTRREDLSWRGEYATVVSGDGRIVIDTDGTTP